MAGLAPATPIVADQAAMLKFFITTNLDTKFLVSLPAKWDVLEVTIKEFQGALNFAPAAASMPRSPQT